MALSFIDVVDARLIFSINRLGSKAAIVCGMRANTVLESNDAVSSLARSGSEIPLWLKIAFTLFMAVLVPVYWANYGPTNFLYFCDAALFLTLYAVWTESSLVASMAAVGILLPQFFWCVDFVCEVAGWHLSGMTRYMFDPHRSLFLRGLSFFHGWLPFLLLFLVLRLGYDRRALKLWTALAWALCLVSFFFLPPAGAVLASPKLPRNINYVFGFSEAKPQTWMPAGLYLLSWMLALAGLLFVPTHLLLRRCKSPAMAPVRAK